MGMVPFFSIGRPRELRGHHLKPTHITAHSIVLRSSRRCPNWVPIMPRDVSFEDSNCMSFSSPPTAETHTFAV